MSNASFLRSTEAPNFTGTLAEQVSFGNYLKKYREGKLQPLDKKRDRTSPFKSLKDKLVAYIAAEVLSA